MTNRPNDQTMIVSPGQLDGNELVDLGTYHDHLERTNLQALAVAQRRDFVHAHRRGMREGAMHSMLDLFLKLLEAIRSTQEE